MPAYALDDPTPEPPEPDRCWIEPSAHVVGPVWLGPYVGIRFGAMPYTDEGALMVVMSNHSDDV